MWRLGSLAVWLFTAAPLAAQWSVGADLGMLRFWGTSIDTTMLGDPAKERPSPAASYAVRVQRRFGTVGVGIGLLYSSGGVRAENGAVAVDVKEGGKLYEVEAVVSSWSPARSGRALRSMRARVRPVVADRWEGRGEWGPRRGRTRVAARRAADRRPGWGCGECECPAGEDPPAEYAQQTTWRRAFSAGINLRL